MKIANLFLTLCLMMQTIQMEAAPPPQKLPSPPSGQVVEEKKKPSLELIIPIDLQLRALRSGNINEAYNLTSDQFKAATPYSAFEKFVKDNDILTTHITIDISSQHKYEDQAEVVIVLDAEKKPIRIRYALIKDPNDEWKILSLESLSNYTPALKNLLKDPKNLYIPLEKFLKDLKEDNILGAYSLFSEELQKQISMPAFEKLLESLPILNDYQKSEFEEPVINDTIGRVEMSLFDNQFEHTFEFTLVVENNAWKISKLILLKKDLIEHKTMEKHANIPATPTDIIQELSPTAEQVVRIDIGVKANEKGVILEPLTDFNAPDNSIYANLVLKNGKVGDRVTITLQHTTTGSTLIPISTIVGQNGESTISVAFAKPSTGWPKGRYKITAEVAKHARFKIFNLE